MQKESTKPRYVLILVACIFLAVMLLISLKVASYGFMPPDDARRHVAKAISGKEWTEILVLRPGVTMDSHVGWHKILEFVYKTTGCEKDSLIVFSIVFLFLLFCVVPIFFLKRPEAWLITFLIIALVQFDTIFRLFLGRPFIFTMAVVAALGYLWPRFRAKPTPWIPVIILTVLIALSTWIHCLWYMFALPVLCFFLAHEWRAGVVVSLCAVVGVIIGTIMTGDPIQFFYQTLGHFFHSLGDHALASQLVTELRPFSGDIILVFAVIGMLAWRALRNEWDVKTIYTPMFILAMVSWVLGFMVTRVWLDWGIPALCVWMALEFEAFLKNSMDYLSVKRVLISLAIACVLFLAVTNDRNSRWTSNAVPVQYLSEKNPEHKKWLPGKGGIVYSDAMFVFYQTFYSNPHADWRYILGCEPTLMPADDLAIFRKIQLGRAVEAYKPWVEKMRPEDRMILPASTQPRIKELEWNNTVSGLWVGRLPRE